MGRRPRRWRLPTPRRRCCRGAAVKMQRRGASKCRTSRSWAPRARLPPVRQRAAQRPAPGPRAAARLPRHRTPSDARVRWTPAGASIRGHDVDHLLPLPRDGGGHAGAQHCQPPPARPLHGHFGVCHAPRVRQPQAQPGNAYPGPSRGCSTTPFPPAACPLGPPPPLGGPSRRPR